MSTDNTSLLWAFCAAARHKPTCHSWFMHRSLLEKADEHIHQLLDAIPDSIAVGKSTQSAAKKGQDVLFGFRPTVPKEVSDHRDPTLPPVRVNWYRDTTYFSETYSTYDPNVLHRSLQLKPDARKESVLAYKPRQVEIYFDEEPDEWNGKRG